MKKNFRIAFTTIIISIIIGTFYYAHCEIYENPHFIMSGKRIDLQVIPNSILIVIDKVNSEPNIKALESFGLEMPCSIIDKGTSTLGVYEMTHTSPDIVFDYLESIDEIKYAGYLYALEGKEIIIDDTFVCKFKDNTGFAKIENLLRSKNIEIVKRFDFAKNCYLLKINDWKQQNILDTCNQLNENKDIEFAYPDFYSELVPQYIPNDPYYEKQWHLKNTGQESAVAGVDVRAEEAWDTTKGSSDLIVAVIDNGIDVNHEDLQNDKILEGKILVEPAANGNPVDLLGEHGTSVSGVIAANIDNGIGLCGVAPECKILPIKLLGGLSKVSSHAEAFVYAAVHGASILNNSWGITSAYDEILPLPDLDKIGLDYAADVGRNGLGCLIFFAAGNDYEPLTPNEITTYKKCITVGAVTDQGVRASYSDYGSLLDLCAPSGGGKTTGIWTSDISGVLGYNMGKIKAGFYGVGVGIHGDLVDQVEYTAAFSYDGINWGDKYEEQEPNENPYNMEGNFVPVPSQISGKCKVGDSDFNGVQDLFYLQIPFESEFYFKLTFEPENAIMIAGMAGFDGQNLLYIFADAKTGGLMEISLPMGDPEGNYTNSFSGTSSACPAASGVAALILSKYPNLTRHEVKWILEETAVKIDSENGLYDLTGKSDFYGWGMVNAKAALDKAAKMFQLKIETIMSNVDEITVSGPLTLKVLFDYPKGRQYWDEKKSEYHNIEFDILLNSKSVFNGNENIFEDYFDIGTFSAIFEMPFPPLPAGTDLDIVFVMRDVNILTKKYKEFTKSVMVDIK
ncbi:S8 family serine peptidase [bacterium]|nr:S8 family serine peptidase [bacterium]